MTSDAELIRWARTDAGAFRLLCASMPAGTLALAGTEPSCTVVREGVEHHCTLARPPPRSPTGPARWSRP